MFLTICNSIVTNSNTAMNTTTRMFYTLTHNRLTPHQLSRTHPKFKTPHIAII